MVFTWTQLNVVFWAISVQRKRSLSDRQANTIKQEIKQSSALNASGCCIISQFSSEYLSLLALHLFSWVPVSCSLLAWILICNLAFLLSVSVDKCSESQLFAQLDSTCCSPGILHLPALPRWDMIHFASIEFLATVCNILQVVKELSKDVNFSALSKDYLLYLNPLILSRQL